MAKVTPNEAKYMQWLQEGFSHGALQLDRLDQAGMAQIHHAAFGGFLTCLKWLCKHGASLKQRSREGSVPAHYAAAGGHKECLRWICKRSPKTASWKDNNGATPLYFAAQEGHLECLKWLAKHTGPAIDHVSSDGMTAVHSAAQEGHLECLKFLVVSAGCDGAVKDHANCTPLHFAAAGGHRMCVHWLLGNVYNYNRSADEESSTRLTPLHVAADQGHLEVVKLLAIFGASLSLRDASGRTPYEMAVYSGNEACAGWLAKVEAMQAEDYANLLEKERSSKKKVRFERKAVWKDFRQSNFSLQLSPRSANREMPATRPRSRTLPIEETNSTKTPESKKKRPQSFSHRRSRPFRNGISGVSFRRWTSVDMDLQRKSRDSSRHGNQQQVVPIYSSYLPQENQTNIYKSTSESGSDSDYSLRNRISRSMSIIRRDKGVYSPRHTPSSKDYSSGSDTEGKKQGYRAHTTEGGPQEIGLAHSAPEIYHSHHDWNIFRKFYRFSKRKLSRSSSFTIQNDTTNSGVFLASYRRGDSISDVQVHDRFTLLNRYSGGLDSENEKQKERKSGYVAGQHRHAGARLEGPEVKLHENAMIW